MDVNSFVLGMKAGKTPSQEKEITVNENGTTEVLPDDGKLLSKVKVNTNVELGFNIAYGTEPPEDTSKLWVKTEQPASNVIVSLDEDWRNGDRPESSTPISKASQPYQQGFCCVGKKLYGFGGTTTAVKVYDTENDVNTTFSGYPYTTIQPACAAVGTKIYVFGGRSSLTATSAYSDVYIYETETDVLQKIEGVAFNLYSSKGGASSGCVVNGTDIHLIGGAYGNGSYSSYHMVFDTVTQTFVRKKAFPAGKIYRPACAVHDGYIYIFGGDAHPNATSDIYRYDIENDEYDKLSTVLPYPVQSMAACAWGRKIYLFGGREGTSSSDAAHSDIMYYDIDAGDIVECESILVTVDNKENLTEVVGAFVIDDAIWVGAERGKVNKYIPKIGEAVLAHNDLQIIPNKPENVFSVLKAGDTRVEVSAGKVRMGDEENKAQNVEASLYKDGEWKKTWQKGS